MGIFGGASIGILYSSSLLVCTVQVWYLAGLLTKGRRKIILNWLVLIRIVWEILLDYGGTFPTYQEP